MSEKGIKKSQGKQDKKEKSEGKSIEKRRKWLSNYLNTDDFPHIYQEIQRYRLNRKRMKSLSKEFSHFRKTKFLPKKQKNFIN